MHVLCTLHSGQNLTKTTTPSYRVVPPLVCSESYKPTKNLLRSSLVRANSQHPENPDLLFPKLPEEEGVIGKTINNVHTLAGGRKKNMRDNIEIEFPSSVRNVPTASHTVNNRPPIDAAEEVPTVPCQLIKTYLLYVGHFIVPKLARNSHEKIVFCGRNPGLTTGDRSRP